MSIPKANNWSFVQLHLAVLLFGGAGLFGKWISVSAGAIVLGRTTCAALFLLLIKTYFKDSYKNKTKKDLLWFALVGSILALHWLAFFQSIKLSSVAIGVITFSTFPVFTILLEAVINKEGISWSNLGLATVAIFGVYLVLPDLNWQSNYTVGFCCFIGSGASFSILTLVNKNLLGRYSSNAVSFWQNGIAALVLLPLFCTDILQSSTQDWILLIVLGILFTGIAHTLFINSMQHIKAQTASLVASLEPVYGILGAWILLGQIPNIQTLLGGSLILAVAFVASMPSRSLE